MIGYFIFCLFDLIFLYFWSNDFLLRMKENARPLPIQIILMSIFLDAFWKCGTASLVSYIGFDRWCSFASISTFRAINFFAHLNSSYPVVCSEHCFCLHPNAEIESKRNHLLKMNLQTLQVSRNDHQKLTQYILGNAKLHLKIKAQF